MPRPKKNEEDLLETIGVKLNSETIKVLDEIASKTETSRSWAGRRLILLGLEQYMRDRRSVFPQLENDPPESLPSDPDMIERVRRDAEATLAVERSQREREKRKPHSKKPAA
jgi:hypothetical protein